MAVFQIRHLGTLAVKVWTEALAGGKGARLAEPDGDCLTFGVRDFLSRLVTLDAEQLERAPALVEACKPDAATKLLRAAMR